MARALNMMRRTLHYRREAFDEGLRAAGYRVVEHLPDPRVEDLVVVWNRYGGFNEVAAQFERAGADVLVVENCPMGNDWLGGKWFSLAMAQVAMTGGRISDGDPQRWESFRQTLEPWRAEGGELLIFAQRCIGHPSAASPPHWAESIHARLGGRIRAHPGMSVPARTLREDCEGVSDAATWSSAAAVQALAMGVAVWNRHPGFVCASAATPLAEFGVRPARRDSDARLRAFHRLAWAMWELEDVRSGAAIRSCMA